MSIVKEQLRTGLRAQRLAMDSAEVASKSQAIAKKLLTEVDFGRMQNLHIYSSVAAWNEVDTESIIRNIKEKWPQLKITIAGLSKSQSIPKKQYDVVIVPVLGFDKMNHRLGLGGGFYDKFLATQPQALKIGISFQNGLIPSGLPHEPHDIPLDKILTEV